MISPLDSKVMDINSEKLGVSVEELMTNAGNALADVIEDCFSGKSVLFVCGTGNNGGDGLAAMNSIDLKCSDVALFAEPKTKAALCQYRKLKKNTLQYDDSLLKKYDVIVDCVLGTGLTGNVRKPYSDYIDSLNATEKIVISCDVPSGFGADRYVRPTMTVTFHDLKEGMTPDNCGNIVIADIGIPKDAYDVVGPGDMLRYPIPEKNAHKGQNGRLLIIGGGPYIGAPAMAGLAALRVGTDLVHIATPESSFVPIASMSPSYIMHRLPGYHLSDESINSLLALSQIIDCVLIGPGLGQIPGTKEAVIRFVSECTKPMVIDADGINALAGEKLTTKAPILYTPHHAELKRLSGGEDPIDAAKRLNAVIVLKGETDFITDGECTRRNKTGTPAMTVGGTGDVLAGAIAGLIAKGMSPFDAGCLGTYICGKAGEKSFDEFSYGMTAPDLIDNIGRVLRDGLS